MKTIDKCLVGVRVEKLDAETILHRGTFTDFQMCWNEAEGAIEWSDSGQVVERKVDDDILRQVKEQRGITLARDEYEILQLTSEFYFLDFETNIGQGWGISYHSGINYDVWMVGEFETLHRFVPDLVKIAKRLLEIQRKNTKFGHNETNDVEFVAVFEYIEDCTQDWEGGYDRESEIKLLGRLDFNKLEIIGA